MILVIDNYDSFTYNVVQELGELGADLTVYRNDKITVDEIRHARAGPHRHITRTRLSNRRRDIARSDPRAWRGNTACSAFVWAIKRSAKHMVVLWYMRRN